MKIQKFYKSKIKQIPVKYKNQRNKVIKNKANHQYKTDYKVHKDNR